MTSKHQSLNTENTIVLVRYVATGTIDRSHLMKAGQYMSSGEPFQLLPGLDQQASVWDRNRHFPRAIRAFN